METEAVLSRAFYQFSSCGKENVAFTQNARSPLVLTVTWSAAPRNLRDLICLITIIPRVSKQADLPSRTAHSLLEKSQKNFLWFNRRFFVLVVYFHFVLLTFSNYNFLNWGHKILSKSSLLHLCPRYVWTWHLQVLWAMSSLNIDIADFMEEVKIKLEDLCCWVDLLRCSNYNALVLSPGEKLNQTLL